MNKTIENIIDKLNLKPHIEGGFYKRIYQSPIDIHLPDRTRPSMTAIYYLLPSQEYSCWHRLKSDEMWHFYSGNNLLLYQIERNGSLTTTRLGNLSESSNAQPQCIIPANTWFAAEVEVPETFALIGCTVSPGFDFLDFEMGSGKNLLSQYPQHEDIIIRLLKD